MDHGSGGTNYQETELQENNNTNDNNTIELGTAGFVPQIIHCKLLVPRI